MTDDELKHAYRARAEREGWPLTTDIHNIARRRSELTRKYNIIEASDEHGVSDRGKTANKWRLKFAPDVCHIMVGLPPQKPPTKVLCPECRDGKPWNCVGQALNPDTDEFEPCAGVSPEKS